MRKLWENKILLLLVILDAVSTYNPDSLILSSKDLEEDYHLYYLVF